MLAKKFRLKERSDFRRIYQRGRSLACPYFVVYYRSSSHPVPRLGFSVSKKLGNAVTRNRQRRRLAELCRHNAELFAPRKDYVFIIRNQMKRATYSQLEAALHKLMAQLGGKV